MKNFAAIAAAFATVAFAAPALAQTADTAAAPAAMDAAAELPICSKDMKDRCRQGSKAEARAADEYKGGGHDNSSMMTAAQADGAKKMSKKK